MKSMFRTACTLLLLMLAAPAALAQSTSAQVGEGYGSVITTSTSWADLVVTYSGMVSTPAFVHNIGTAKVVVFFTASGSAPTAGGIVLKPGDTLTGNAAHVWIRSIDATGAVTVGKLADLSLPVPSASASSGTAAAVTPVAAGSLVAKASGGTLYGVNVTAGASAGYVLIFNATTAPADGTVTPARCIPLAANTGIEVNYRSVPLYFATGITVVFSTTGCFSKTVSATAFIAADVK